MQSGSFYSNTEGQVFPTLYGRALSLSVANIASTLHAFPHNCSYAGLPNQQHLPIFVLKPSEQLEAALPLCKDSQKNYVFLGTALSQGSIEVGV
jgi:hypothetical protein